MNLLNLCFSNKKEKVLPCLPAGPGPFIVVGKTGVQGVHRGSCNLSPNSFRRASLHLNPPPPTRPLRHLVQVIAVLSIGNTVTPPSAGGVGGKRNLIVLNARRHAPRCFRHQGSRYRRRR